MGRIVIVSKDLTEMIDQTITRLIDARIQRYMDLSLCDWILNRRLYDYFITDTRNK